MAREWQTVNNDTPSNQCLSLKQKCKVMTRQLQPNSLVEQGVQHFPFDNTSEQLIPQVDFRGSIYCQMIREQNKLKQLEWEQEHAKEAKMEFSKVYEVYTIYFAEQNWKRVT